MAKKAITPISVHRKSVLEKYASPKFGKQKPKPEKKDTDKKKP